MTIGGGYGGASGSISLNIETLDQSVNADTTIGESFTSYNIGRADVPAPIKIKLVAIDEAMASSFWNDSERDEINQKRMHLCKALDDYAKNKGAHIADGRLMIMNDNRVGIMYSRSRMHGPITVYLYSYIT